MRKALLFLGILDDSDLDWMIASGVKRDLDPSEVLITEGQPIDSLFVVLDGRLSVLASAQANREVARLQCGEIVGEMSFVDARPPSATVRAIERSSVLAVPRAVLAARLAQDIPFAARFYRALAVFLADRLRGTVAVLGYSKGMGLDDRVYSDEIDPDVLDRLSIAGARFQLLQQRLQAI